MKNRLSGLTFIKKMGEFTPTECLLKALLKAKLHIIINSMYFSFSLTVPLMKPQSHCCLPRVGKVGVVWVRQQEQWIGSTTAFAPC